MKAFRVTGEFQMGHGWQRFEKEVAADDEGRARETVLSDLGSRHRVKRTQVSIQRVRELKPDEVQDAAVEYRLGGAKE